MQGINRERAAMPSSEATSGPQSPAPAGQAQRSGRCLCGAVSYLVDGPMRAVWNCHCERCRRWTGHFMAASFCAREHLRLLSDATLTWHAVDEDPNVGYGFCSRCGSSLFWKLINDPARAGTAQAGNAQAGTAGDGAGKVSTDQGGDRSIDEQLSQVAICAGTLDPPTGLKTERAIFTSHASDYHQLDPEIPARSRD